MSMQFYFENYQEHKNLALEAYKLKDEKKAKYHLFKAAEFLLKMAKESTGQIRQIRYQNAQKLVELAKRIKIKKTETPLKVKEEEEIGEAPQEWVVQEKPNVYFDDIAGLEEVKQQIKIKMIYPFLYPELAEKYKIKKGGGVLLFGPPGTGKTMLAKAMATELDATFFLISPSDILNKWVGESEKNVKRLFEAARKCHRAVIFIDEVEALLPKRHTTYSTIMQRVVPQILSEIDGFESATGGNILFVGATNEPWAIDRAMLRPGRFDEKIYIGLPDLPARKKILEMNLKDLPLDESVDFDLLASRLENYSGADIVHLCRKVSEKVFIHAIKSEDERKITMNDFEQVLKDLVPSVSPKDLEKYEKFRFQ